MIGQHLGRLVVAAGGGGHPEANRPARPARWTYDGAVLCWLPTCRSETTADNDDNHDTTPSRHPPLRHRANMAGPITLGAGGAFQKVSGRRRGGGAGEIHRDGNPASTSPSGCGPSRRRTDELRRCVLTGDGAAATVFSRRQAVLCRPSAHVGLACSPRARGHIAVVAVSLVSAI